MKNNFTLYYRKVPSGKTESMTDNYTHFDPLEFTEVNKIQEKLLAPKESKSEKERPTLKLVKKPETEKAEHRKQAS